MKVLLILFIQAELNIASIFLKDWYGLPVFGFILAVVAIGGLTMLGLRKLDSEPT